MSDFLGIPIESAALITAALFGMMLLGLASKRNQGCVVSDKPKSKKPRWGK